MYSIVIDTYVLFIVILGEVFDIIKYYWYCCIYWLFIVDSIDIIWYSTDDWYWPVHSFHCAMQVPKYQYSKYCYYYYVYCHLCVCNYYSSIVKYKYYSYWNVCLLCVCVNIIIIDSNKCIIVSMHYYSVQWRTRIGCVWLPYSDCGSNDCGNVYYYSMSYIIVCVHYQCSIFNGSMCALTVYSMKK